MQYPIRTLPALVLLLSTIALTAQSNPSFQMKRDTFKAYGAEGIAQGDFNGDNKPDLILGGGSSGTTITFRPGNGDGTFGAPTMVGQADSAQVLDIASADMDHDGKLDVVALCIGGTFDVFFGNGNGTFQPVFAAATVNSPRAMTIGDFNGDHLLDIAIGDVQGDVEIFNNTAGRSFALNRTLTVDAGKEILNVRAGDFNGDGSVNLAVLSYGAAWVLWNDGHESFRQIALTGFTSPAGLNVGDLNQDGMEDILISYDCHPDPQNSGPKGPASDCEGIEIFYGQGQQKTFLRPIIFADGIGAANQLWAVDVNGDGVGDIVTAATAVSAQTGLFVWLGHTDGSFDQTPSRFIATTDGIGHIIPGDFNRDGMTDIAAVLPGDGETEIYLNATVRPGCATSQINPTVTVCQPVDRTYLPGSSIRVQANAYDANQVTAMQLYANGNLVYSQPVSSFDQSFSLGTGSFYLVVKAWDYTGLNFRSIRHVNLYNGTPGVVCSAAPASANICLPASATSASPVHVVANGYTTTVPTAAQLYVDGVLVVNDTSCDSSNYCAGGTSGVDTYQNLSAGSHQLVFKLWDANGSAYTASKNVTVQ